MNKENIKKILASNPAARPSYFRRPHWTRRNFFRLAGAGITASFLAKEASAQAPGTCTSQNMTTINKATNVIFILMAGAPSHVDTFDFKNTAGVTPAAAAPETVNGILWPTGILPKLGAITNQFSIVRSLQAHALVHSLGQTWVQIGRNPAASLGNIAPNIGSIVALQKAAERQPGRRPAHISRVEFRWRGQLRLSRRDLCAVQSRSLHRAASPIPPTHSARRAGRKCIPRCTPKTMSSASILRSAQP